MLFVALRRLLLSLALLGIVFGPVSVGVAASAMARSSEMQMAAMPGMDNPDDMSCCPEEKPVQKSDCASACPLALICSSSILVHEPKTDGWQVNLAWRGLSHDLLQEGHLPSALVEPPARPPKA
ncbi:hypothetical protein [Ensifer sp. LC163]|uniref:hypothetical protein n=1 Tax=Ensifer sp. LC163 TaxID=1120652 RepID=UPI000A8A3DE0|nr:hypothetical protein [Ensifer sp. LC163]